MSVNDITMNVRGIPMLRQSGPRHRRPRTRWAVALGVGLAMLAWF